MAKYLKDSKGIVRATTTTNLELEKPLTNDNYDIGVHNRNMDKLDVAINNVKNEVSSMEFVSTKVIRPNKQTVEASLVANENSIGNHSGRISANETSILSLQNADGNLSQLQTSNKSNLVGAINELFQNANNGKSTIATAVGSPLSSGDTFSAMGSKIDTLTSKFKTNLNAKGVSTSSSDKMSNLIDKVGTISTGKKWASGTVTSNSTTGTIQFLNSTTTRSLYSIEISNIGFKPRYIIATHHYGSTTTFKTMYVIERDIERMSVMTESLSNVSSECHVYKPYGNFIVRDGYALLPAMRSSSSYEWIAFE